MKALALFSGGLDSILAIKLVLEQGIDVEGINFVSPFWSSKKNLESIKKINKVLNIPLKTVILEDDYLRMIKKPKHGYGKNINPCIDCKIFMLKKAKKIAKQINAQFIITGEVLDERPMSQNKKALDIIEKEAGLKGKILRPLSAKFLPETEDEKKGLVDREKLLDIRGKGRKRQIELAKKFRINDYPSPSGGCLLTYKEFASKIRDLFEHKKNVRIKDIPLLKIGRHFRFVKNKIIVGRNEIENKQLLDLKNPYDYVFEVSEYNGPITILQGQKTKEAIKKAAALTVRYSDTKRKVLVKFGRKKLNKTIIIQPITEGKIEKMRIT